MATFTFTFTVTCTVEAEDRQQASKMLHVALAHGMLPDTIDLQVTFSQDASEEVTP